jgi:hypothetical protein
VSEHYIKLDDIAREDNIKWSLKEDHLLTQGKILHSAVGLVAVLKHNGNLSYI